MGALQRRNSILTGSQNAAANDVWTVAAINTTLYVLQNGTQVGTTTDSTYSSGIAALAAFASNGLQDVQYSNFACGMASTTAPVTVYSQPDCRVAPNNSVTVNQHFAIHRDSSFFFEILVRHSVQSDSTASRRQPRRRSTDCVWSVSTKFP